VSYRHVIIYYFLLKSEPILPAMWVFFPEAKYRFGRLSEMTQFSPHVAPPGHTALMVDFTCEDNDPYWSMNDVDLGKTLQNQMQDLKLFNSPQLIKGFSRRFKNFYPIYSMGYQENIEAIRRLETLYNNLFFVGRVGDFNYNNTDQCMDMGYRVADHVITKGEVSQGWQDTRRQKFESYRIVD
jgi:protoporphyrinogen oxidase